MGWWHDVETWKWDESGGEEMHHTFDVMNVVLLGWKSDVFHTLINILIRNESRSIWKMQRLCICITQPHYRSTPSSQTPSFLRPSEDFPFVGACLQESQSDFCWLPCDGGQIPMCSRVGCFWLCWLKTRCTKPLLFRMQVWPWEANQRCWFSPTHHALTVYHCFVPLYAMTERTPKGWQLRFYENKAWSHHVANVVWPPAWPSRPPKTRKNTCRPTARSCLCTITDRCHAKKYLITELHMQPTIRYQICSFTGQKEPMCKAVLYFQLLNQSSVCVVQDDNKAERTGYRAGLSPRA